MPNARHMLVYAAAVYPTKDSETNALLLANSIRKRAGSLSECPIWFFTPFYGQALSERTEQRLQDLDVYMCQFHIDRELIRFPFLAEAHAAAEAEEEARQRTEALAWLAANTIVVTTPFAYVLDQGVSVKYRPVHHKLIGSSFDEPIDEFWKLMYEKCGVKDTDLFPMNGHVDGAKIRPYFNAGSVILRPELGLLTKWSKEFLRIHRQSEVTEFVQKDDRYAIFLHQAVLTGVILSNVKREELIELPNLYNYPIHLHSEDRTENRPNLVDECVTLRHEGFYNNANWYEVMESSAAFKDWLKIYLDSLGVSPMSASYTPRRS
jgi:hypothetical protein